MTAGTQSISFADLIHPISEKEFFNQYYDKKPLYIKATDAKKKKFQECLNWDNLTAILNMTTIWSSQSLQLVLDRQMLPAHAYCQKGLDRDGQEVLQPDAKKIMNLLQRGASLVSNDIADLLPGLQAIAMSIEEQLNTKVQGNLYCSWKARQAFDSHYDTHDVLAAHFIGEKVWNVYENRAPHPIAHPDFKLGVMDHIENRGALKMEVRMQPGDLLYLPRGWYHDALASDDAAVHIAFGATGCIGLDFLDAMYSTLMHEELFRRNLPRTVEGVEATAKHLKSLADRFKELAYMPEVAQQMHLKQKDFRYPRAGIQLSSQIASQISANSQSKPLDYQLAAGEFKVVRRGKDWVLVSGKTGVPIPPQLNLQVKWVIDKKGIILDDLKDTFNWENDESMMQFVQNMVNMKVIKKAS